MRRLAWLVVTGAVLAVPVGAAGGQGLVPVRRHVFGVSGALMQPTGEFGQFVRWGGGGDLSFVVGLDRHGTLGLRLAGSVLWYGHEHYDVWFGPRVPDAWARVSTNNFITTVGVGPQLTLGTGAVRPYGHGMVGFSYFATTSSVDDAYGYHDSALNFDDLRPALSAGGGMLVRLGGQLYLDLGAQWTHNGRTNYLLPGSLIDNFDGTVTAVPIRSDANHWTFRLGIGVGF